MANTPTVTKPTYDELVKALAEKTAALETASTASVVIHESRSASYAKKAWEEEIWVEAIRDCTYPNVNDTYPQYRKADKDGGQGEVFRIAYREHLNHAMRELTPGAERPIVPAKQIPQTAARGVRVMTQAH